MKAVVAAFNQEKALLGTFSVIANLRMELFEALHYSLPSTQTLSVLVVPAPAPVPRCSPFIFINKLAEWTNVWSDSNPYFPVPPCEYGGPLEALARGDLQ